MPLAIKEEPKVDSKFTKLRKRAGQTVREVFKASHGNLLEIIIIVFIIANLFINLKILFALYIIFYFADRWNVMKLFERQVITHEQSKVVVEQEEK